MANPNIKLEAARLQKCWSVAEASERARVSFNTFNRWERGLQVPHMATLALLCEAFGMTVEELGFADVVKPKRLTKVLLQDSYEVKHLSMMLQQQPISHIQDFTWRLDDMNQPRNKSEGISRREIIAALVSAPAAMFSLAQSGNVSLLHPEEIVSLSSVNVPMCWRLYFEGGLKEAKTVLPGYLSQLSMLAEESSPYQKSAAGLASQAYQLACMLALQNQDFGTALLFTNQAFQLGKIAENHDLLTASLIRRALVYRYLKHPKRMLQTYEEALQYVDIASPLLRSRVYMGLSNGYSWLEQEQEALRFQSLAHETFPERFMDDPNFPYTYFNTFSLAGHEGRTYLFLKQPDKAWESFSKADKIVAPTLVPERVELTLYQATTSIALVDLDLSCTYIESAVTSASALGSHLRVHESYEVYASMLGKWGNEARVKALGELFHQ
jgi:transcriptional regulator with XRE-family HTH domain